MHAHKCEKCQTVFYHSDEMQGNINAHKCPACGSAEWKQFQAENAKLPKFAEAIPYSASLWLKAADVLNVISAALLCIGAGYIIYRTWKIGQVAA